MAVALQLAGNAALPHQEQGAAGDVILGFREVQQQSGLKVRLK
jgi:hypothetical protein